MQFDELSYRVIGCALEVHRRLGPGLLESAYEACLAYELKNEGVDCCTQVALPIKYREVELDCGYRIDLLIPSQLIVELKAVTEMTPLHEAQLLTYMKLAKIPTGLLINFNTSRLKDGIKRMVLG